MTSEDIFYMGTEFLKIRDLKPLTKCLQGKRRKMHIKSTTKYIRWVADQVGALPKEELPLFLNKPKQVSMFKDMVLWRLQHDV